jgi:hypothetical protein
MLLTSAQREGHSIRREQGAEKKAWDAEPAYGTDMRVIAMFSSDHAHFVVIAPPAYRTFFWRHQTRLLFWTSTRAKESNVCSLENLQPVICVLLMPSPHVAQFSPTISWG